MHCTLVNRMQLKKAENFKQLSLFFLSFTQNSLARKILRKLMTIAKFLSMAINGNL